MDTKGHEKFKGKLRLSTNIAGSNVQTMKTGQRHPKMDRLNTKLSILF
jgi:hypothetical protein